MRRLLKGFQAALGFSGTKTAEKPQKQRERFRRIGLRAFLFPSYSKAEHLRHEREKQQRWMRDEIGDQDEEYWLELDEQRRWEEEQNRQQAANDDWERWQ